MRFTKHRKTILETLQELRRIEAIVSLWPDRVAATGLSDAAFCTKAKRDPATFCRWCKGKQVPDDKSIKVINRTLERLGA